MFSGQIESAGKTNSPKNVPDPGLALPVRQRREKTGLTRHKTRNSLLHFGYERGDESLCDECNTGRG